MKFLQVWPRLSDPVCLPGGGLLPTESTWATALFALIEFRARLGGKCSDSVPRLAKAIGVDARTYHSWLNQLVTAGLVEPCDGGGLAVNKVLADARVAALKSSGLRPIKVERDLAAIGDLRWGPKLVLAKVMDGQRRRCELSSAELSHDVGISRAAVRKHLARLRSRGIAFRSEDES